MTTSISLNESSTDPTQEPNKVELYAKDDGGTSQLFARSDDGTVHQITPAGGGGAPAVIFDDAVPANEVNIRSDRATNQSPINNANAGITNLGSNSGGVAAGATGNYSTIGGGDNNAATAPYSTVSGGRDNVASDRSAYAEGEFNVASNDAAHAEGQSTAASGIAAHSEGRETIASGNHSHAEGRTTTAAGENSHAEGQEAQANGGTSHAEGTNTRANGSNAHAEGNGAIASGEHSHAEGSSTASNQYAHAEGHLNTASGFGSHAEGRDNLASGNYSHAEGNRAVASRESQSSHACGRIVANGDAQTSQIVTRLPTANAPIDSGLRFGEGAGSAALILADNKSYAIRAHACAAGGTGGAISAYLIRDFIVNVTGGVASIIAPGLQTIIGHATAVASWFLDGAVDGTPAFTVTFSTGADVTTTNISVAARVEFVEVLNVA